MRRTDQVLRIAVRLVAVAFAVFQLYVAYGPLDPVVVRVTHVAFGQSLIFLVYAASGRRREVYGGWDGVLLAGLSLLIAVYVFENFYVRAFDIGAEPPILDLVLGGALIVLTLEAARRTVGLGFTILTLLVLLYARFGELFPGVLYHRDLPVERIITDLFLTTEGMYGTLTGISATFVFLFVLFGAVLRASGAGDFFIELASALLGHFRGGPAKVAVVASTLFAMISSSGIANAAATGQLTIPLMKSAGYKPRFAAGVEAVSSEAGLITPPVMGGTVFIMMEILGVSYVDIMQSVVLIAFLYYVALFIMIDLEAARTNLVGLPRERLPELGATLRKGWHFFSPPLLLVYMLVVVESSPTRAAFWSILSIPLVTWLRPSQGMGPRRIFEALEQGAMQALPVIGVLVCANIIVGILDVTGVGLLVSGMLVALAGNSVFLLLLLTMVATIILGMGLPTIASYVLLVVTVAPALTQAGIDPLAAHLFIFYFSMISQITPPIAPTAFVTASIAGAPFMPSALTALRLATAIIVLPYLLIYNHVFMLRGDTGEIVLAAVSAMAGIFLVAGALQGYLLGRMGWIARAAALVGGGCLLFPGAYSDVVGVAVLLVLLAWQQRSRLVASAAMRGLRADATAEEERP